LGPHTQGTGGGNSKESILADPLDYLADTQQRVEIRGKKKKKTLAKAPSSLLKIQKGV